MALTDMISPRLVELGKIKIGGLGEVKTSAKGTQYRVPRKDDHFTITTMHREQQQGGARGDLVVDKALMDELIKDYGDPDGFLRKIPVYLLSDDIEDIMQSSYCCYSGQACLARSDGQTVTWFADPRTGKRYAEPKTSAWKPGAEKTFLDSKGNPYFKKHTVFNCVIASQVARWGGVYKFRTTSVISSEQLYGSLINIAKITRGVLTGISMWLRVSPLQVMPGGRPTNIYVVSCDLLGRDMIAIQQQALKAIEANFAQAKQIEHINVEFKKLVRAPGFEDDVEASEVQEEFHPERNSEAPPDQPPLGSTDLSKAKEDKDKAIADRSEEIKRMLREAQTKEACLAIAAEAAADKELLAAHYAGVAETVDQMLRYWQEQEQAPTTNQDADLPPSDVEPPDEPPDF